MRHLSNRRAFALAPALLTISLALGVTCSAAAVEQESLTLESKIPLGNVRGRIDHLVIDQTSQRLFVSELGNNSLGVVDLKGRKVLHRIAGLNETRSRLRLGSWLDLCGQWWRRVGEDLQWE